MSTVCIHSPRVYTHVYTTCVGLLCSSASTHPASINTQSHQRRAAAPARQGRMHAGQWALPTHSLPPTTGADARVSSSPTMSIKASKCSLITRVVLVISHARKDEVIRAVQRRTAPNTPLSCHHRSTRPLCQARALPTRRKMHYLCTKWDPSLKQGTAPLQPRNILVRYINYMYYKSVDAWYVSFLT